MERMQEIGAQVNSRVEIALHRTSDFSPSLMKECIGAGAIKLNINKLLLEVWNDYLVERA
jgi:fructose-bisphosphate aldolase, class II